MRDRGRRRAESWTTVHSSADRWVVSDRRSPLNESPREAAFVPHHAQPQTGGSAASAQGLESWGRKVFSVKVPVDWVHIRKQTET